MKVLSFGELLFDRYPSGEKIGGAPFNFSAHLSQLGDESYLLTAVGEDALGDQALQIAKSYGVNTSLVKRHPSLPTGVCNVTYRGTEPVYELCEGVSYDEIPYSPKITGQSFDVLYFGTLASRNEFSKNTLQKLIASNGFPTLFFDMNLRMNYYSETLILQGMKASQIVKMNREEFQYVKHCFAPNASHTEDAMITLSQAFDIETLLLTLDKEGAMVYDQREGFCKIPCKEGEFVSAVGAGDSFCACFLHHLKKGTPLKGAMEKAALLASFVVSQEEAVPSYPADLRKKLEA